MDTALKHRIHERSAGRCEMCGHPLGGEGVAHHRRLRSQGGTDTPANLLLLHDRCHRGIHANPLWARRHGFIVPSWADPDTTPVRPCGDLVCDHEAVADTANGGG